MEIRKSLFLFCVILGSDWQAIKYYDGELIIFMHPPKCVDNSLSHCSVFILYMRALLIFDTKINESLSLDMRCW